MLRHLGGVASLVVGMLLSAGLPTPPVAFVPLRQVAYAQASDVCPEPNDTFQQACYLDPSRPLDSPSYISRPDDVDAYRFEVADFGTTYVVNLVDPQPAYRVSIADWNGRVMGSATGDLLSVPIPMPGSYYLFVDSPDGQFSETVPYKLMGRTAQRTEGYKRPETLFTSNFFDQNAGGPPVRETENARITRENGGIGIDMLEGGGPRTIVRAGMVMADSRGYATAQDFTWTSDTRVVRGSDENGFVLRFGFRVIDNDNFHQFLLDPQSGSMRLYVMENRRERYLVPWTTTDVVDTNGGVNRVTIRAFGTNVLIYVNGARVLQVDDAIKAAGQFGIGLEVYKSPPAIRFDNVLITTPGLAP